jgi:hypothetical protein
MGKAVKKVATIAATAAAVYYGGKALMASNIFGPQSVGPVSKFVGGIHKGIAGVKAGIGASLFGASTLQKVGLGLQGISYMQQRKFASAQASATKQAAEEQRRINEMQERVRLVQERRQRLDIVRQQRIQQGTIEAGTAAAGLGMQGTSGFIGATGAIQTQATANLEAINMASGASTAIGQASQRAADYTTAANLASGKQTMYSNLGTLGQNIFKQSDEIANIFKFEV